MRLLIYYAFPIFSFFFAFIFSTKSLAQQDVFDITCDGTDVITVSCGDTRSSSLIVDGQGFFDDVLYYNCDCQHPAPSGCPNDPGSEIQAQKQYLEDVYAIIPTGDLLKVTVTNHARLAVYFTTCTGTDYCDQISYSVQGGQRVYNLDLSNSSFGSPPVYVVLDGFNTDSEFNSNISYTISFSCSTSEPDFDCGDAQTLPCNSTINSSNIGLSNQTNSYGCITGTNSDNFTGGEKIFRFNPTMTGDYTFTLSNFGGDLDMFLLSSCDPSNCISRQGASSSSTEILTRTLNQGSSYYLIIDGYNGTSSTFNLEVDCPEEPGGCENAKELRCGVGTPGSTLNETDDYNSGNYGCFQTSFAYDGNDVIYRFNKPNDEAYLTAYLYHSSGRLNNLSFFIFSVCPDGSNCIAKGTDLLSGSSVVGEYWSDLDNPLPAGEYFIVVDGSTASYNSTFRIKVECDELDCDEVEEISLGETKKGESNVNGPDNISSYSCNGSLVGYTGKERIYMFTLTEEKTISISLDGMMESADFDLFLLNDCSASACMGYSTNTTGKMDRIGPVSLTAGTYYILVDIKNRETNLVEVEREGSFDLSLSEGSIPSEECTACSGLVNQHWYDSLIQIYTECCSLYNSLPSAWAKVQIFECTFQNQTVIHIPPTTCTDSLGLIYDCDGKQVLSYTSTDTVELQNCRLIWSCDKDQAGCKQDTMRCKLSELLCTSNTNTLWLTELQDSLMSCCSDQDILIYQCTYQGQTAIHVPPLFCNIADDQGDVYSCDGTILFRYGGISGEYNIEKLDSLENCQLIWSCKNNKTNCSHDTVRCKLSELVCTSTTDTMWLKELQNSLMVCCSDQEVFIYQCTYQGQTAIHVPPLYCNIADDQGDVYSCDGTLLFRYGGIFGGYNMEKLDSLENCQLIWSCKNNQTNCSPGGTDPGLSDDCIPCDSMVNQTWYNDLIKDFSECCEKYNRPPYLGNVSIRVYECTLQGQKVVHIPPNFSCSEPSQTGFVYDCNGNLIFSYLNDHYLLDSLENCTLIWYCDKDVEGCDIEEKECRLTELACPTALDTSWLQVIQDSLSKCCSGGSDFSIWQCTYQGNPVIHVTPFYCDSVIAINITIPGYVYSCDGTLLFSYLYDPWLGILTNREKLDSLENCQRILVCQNESVYCQPEQTSPPDTAECTACNGVVDQEWYTDLTRRYTECCSIFSQPPYTGVSVKIFECTYQGKTVIHVPPTSCEDSQGKIFDCNGDQLFRYNARDTLIANQLSNCKLIWSCDKYQAGCTEEEGPVDTEYCTACRPVTSDTIENTEVFNQEWYNDLIRGFSECCERYNQPPYSGNVSVRVYQCIFRGQIVIHIPPNFSCSAPSQTGFVYDCNGNLLFSYLNDHYLLDSLENCTLIWYCDRDLEGCDIEEKECRLSDLACTSAQDNSWLQDLQDSLSKCCSLGNDVSIWQCIYQGNPVIHVTPTASCNFVNTIDFGSTGFVYSCNGTLLFSYLYNPLHGVLTNREKLDSLEDCERIWVCQNGSVYCEPEQKSIKDTLPPWNFQVTGESHTVIILESLQSNIGGSVLQVGDFIGFFYNKDGMLYNAGFAKWENRNLAIAVYGNDNESDKNGFDTGESFIVRVWRASTSEEITVKADFIDPGEGIITHKGQFAADGISGIRSLSTTLSQTIVLNGGWNMISSYLIPENTSIEVIFSDLKDYIDIVKNGEGNTFIPSFNIDNIGVWDYKQGYKVKLNTSLDTAHLIIRGQMVSGNEKLINLSTGWHIIAYLCSQSSSVKSQFASVQSSVDLIKNNSGASYIPSFNIDNINCMMPGQGYKVKINAPFTDFSYSCSPSCTETIKLDNTLEKLQTHVASDNNATIILPAHVLKPLINQGEIIEVVSSSGNKFGQGTFYGRNLALTLWGDDFQTESLLEGFEPYEGFLFNVLDPVSKTSRPLKINLQNKTPSYLEDFIYIAQSAEQIAPGTDIRDELLIYPNPASFLCTIEILSNKATTVRIDCIDINGRILRRFDKVSLIEGLNVHQLDVRSLLPGLYTIRVSDSERVYSGKLAIMD